MTDQQRREAFCDAWVGGNGAHLSVGPGINICARATAAGPGLALQVTCDVLQSGQLQRVLERRFAQAAAFKGCFIYLDTMGNLVIWHALPTQRQALDETLSRLLSLASLEALDRRAYR
ncbi:transcriptional regulator [Pseudomonas sp. BCA14]|uniref:transcriptional regulator n=1 Tax=unclassified Pseudomonas TaxID=196821 RepID=UPI00106E3E73|nr:MULTISPECIES: transcriptional regulator [unclassified Pseudomonas]TFF10217.1 transcriptional regulator [Pseudomonas sp. JMN1]TFF12359.1 transcriptional regulator [Pseudomonas sp. BCA17]TFF25764.1 transcriptional regulator [Pseudomonas sp. BCA13]TFF29135.1 transcriptional regulator [Pseudomonas sp. BCA14]